MTKIEIYFNCEASTKSNRNKSVNNWVNEERNILNSLTTNGTRNWRVSEVKLIDNILIVLQQVRTIGMISMFRIMSKFTVAKYDPNCYKSMYSMTEQAWIRTH